MAGGDIASTLFALAVMAVAAWLFIEWMVWLAREWVRFLADGRAAQEAGLAARQAMLAEMTRAEAIVPELAAARFGGCSATDDD